MVLESGFRPARHANSSMRQAGRSRSKSIPIAIFNTYDLFQEPLKWLFPSWEAVRTRYREVVLFVAGLMKDSRPIVQHLYEMQVEDYLNTMRTGDLQSIDADLLESLHTESSIRLFDDPLHNKYINYYNHDPGRGDPNTTPVYFPSRLYHFYKMRHEVVLENHLIQGEEIPPCSMSIDSPREAVSDALLSICSQISKHQPVSDLCMEFDTCNSLEAPRLTNPWTVFLYQCKFPDFEKLLRQLFSCGETLQKLVLRWMNLAPFESLLDDLLEDLVAHHEAGLAQRKLELWLWEDDEHPTNLSEEFEEKWRNRCQSIDSIDCEFYDDG